MRMMSLPLLVRTKWLRHLWYSRTLVGVSFSSSSCAGEKNSQQVEINYSGKGGIAQILDESDSSRESVTEQGEGEPGAGQDPGHDEDEREQQEDEDQDLTRGPSPSSGERSPRHGGATSLRLIKEVMHSSSEALHLVSIDEWLPSLKPEEVNIWSTDFGNLVGGLFPETPRPEIEVANRYNEVRRRAVLPLLRQILHLFREDTPLVYENPDTRTTENNNDEGQEAEEDTTPRSSVIGAKVLKLQEYSVVSTSMPWPQPQSDAASAAVAGQRLHEHDHKQLFPLIPAVLSQLVSETRGSCFDMLLALEWIITNLFRYHIELTRKELDLDVQAVSRNCHRAFLDNTLINEYNEVAGMELFFFRASRMVRIMETYLHLLLAVVMLQPHCFNQETRLTICRLLTEDVRRARRKWNKMEFVITWKNLYHTADAYRLKTHVENILETGVYDIFDIFLKIQRSALRAVLDQRPAALANRRGANTDHREIGHDWTPVETTGGFIDFLYLYRTAFDGWVIDRDLVRAVIKLFAGKFDSLLDVGAGGGQYSQLLELGFSQVVAVDASSIAAEVTDGRVQFADLASDHMPQRIAEIVSAKTTGQKDNGSSRGEDDSDEKAKPDIGDALSNAGQAEVMETPQFNVVFCIEVAEHVAKESEDALLANLHALTEHFLVLSWSNDRDNDYHVNPLPPDRVVAKVEAMGFRLDNSKTTLLKEKSSVSWIKQNVMVFEKVS
ncbi:unnamed protein product [Amoebophrya sp. A25]|nr:unnamed protein product [Amoebophrya sp. A25]|eukprot:GSA25T00007841001.1